MRHSGILAIVALVLFSNCERVFSQSNTFPWPTSGVIGIGTTLPKNALTLSFNSDIDTAIIRLTNDTSSVVYGILGLMPYSYPYYSSLSTGEDLIIHEHSQGDIILTNYQSTSLAHPFGAIRFATTPGASDLPMVGAPPHDVERFSILPNGNIGINLPPNTTSGLDSARDQVQIGGGSAAPAGYTSPIPGLTMYGGNRFEGMAEPLGSALPIFPVDWRGIAFNEYKNHVTGYSARFAPMSGSGIGFAPDDSGLVNITVWPWKSGDTLTDFSGGLTLQMTGNYGLSFQTDERWHGGNQYHHIFDAIRPGVLPYGVTRNVQGLFYHNTPVYIGSDTSGPFCNFTNLTNLHPAYGDDSTWMLAVNGSALAKEFYVSLKWPDFVFDPGYKLTPLDELQKFIDDNHHLPGIPSAKEMDTSGIPIGKTEAALTQKLEELTRYILQLNDRIDTLESELHEKKGEK